MFIFVVTEYMQKSRMHFFKGFTNEKQCFDNQHAHAKIMPKNHLNFAIHFEINLTLFRSHKATSLTTLATTSVPMPDDHSQTNELSTHNSANGASRPAYGPKRCASLVPGPKPGQAHPNGVSAPTRRPRPKIGSVWDAAGPEMNQNCVQAWRPDAALRQPGFHQAASRLPLACQSRELAPCEAPTAWKLATMVQRFGARTPP